jgi:hypothetical protein
MSKYSYTALIDLVFFLMTSAVAMAESTKKYQVSLRYAYTPGNLVF